MSFAAGPAAAQTASQITPRSAQPVMRTPSGAIALPQASNFAAPAGADKLTVQLADVVVDGGLPELAELTQTITRPLAHRTVSVAEIFAAAQLLEQSYAEAGYVLVRVVLPAQTLNNGDTLHFTIINGFIERVEAKNVPERVRRRVERVLADLVGVKPMTLRLLERKLLIAAETPGTQLRSALSAGGAPGASVLTVETTYRAVGGDVGTDNTLSRALGSWNSTVGLQLNSVGTLGEQVYARTTGYWNDADDNFGFFGTWPRNRSYAGGLTLPIGTDGLVLNLEATRSQTTPTAGLGAPTTTSTFDRYSARLRYPLIRARNLTLASEVALDIQDERLATVLPLAADLSLDKLRVLRSTNDLSWLTQNGDLIGAKLQSSYGIDGLGARSAAQATPLLPLSRQGADDDFRKLEITLTYSRLLADHFAVDMRAYGQISFGDALPRSEQIGIATLNGLSSFDSGSLQGDQGFVVRGEVSSPWSIAVPLQGTAQAVLSVTPYAFGAGGVLWLEQPTAVEQAETNARSWGLGLRLGAQAAQDGLPATGLTFEWGRQQRDDGVPAEDRLTATGSFQF